VGSEAGGLRKEKQGQNDGKRGQITPAKATGLTGLMIGFDFAGLRIGFDLAGLVIGFRRDT
jgi:hypothetical protein